jgi:hypothetical protein
MNHRPIGGRPYNNGFKLTNLSDVLTQNFAGPTADGVMASMFWVPTSAAEPKMPGYDYDPRWFCDRDTPSDCTAGWPGWSWDQPRGASLGRAYSYAHVASQYLGKWTISSTFARFAHFLFCSCTLADRATALGGGGGGGGRCDLSSSPRGVASQKSSET